MVWTALFYLIWYYVAFVVIKTVKMQSTNVLLYLDIVFLSLSVVHSIISMLEQWPALFTTKYIAVLCSWDFFLLQNLCTILTYILIKRAPLMRSLLHYGMLSQSLECKCFPSSSNQNSTSSN